MLLIDMGVFRPDLYLCRGNGANYSAASFDLKRNFAQVRLPENLLMAVRLRSNGLCTKIKTEHWKIL